MLFYYPNRPRLVPPYPDLAHPSPDNLLSLERSGKYIAELKWNGDNVSLYTDSLAFMNRQRKLLTRYHPSEEVIEELNKLPKKAVFNLELVDAHTTDVKDLLIVHCVMVWNDKPLIGKTWGDSRGIIENEIESGKHIKISQIHRTGFWDLFQQADNKSIEGIILKDPTGLLVFSTSPGQETTPGVSWMLKMRKPKPGQYQF
jgi:ATP-dependent DNA ligase